MHDRALVYDLSKAYHQMQTTEKEFFMRLVCWKYEKDGKWHYYGHTCVGMGDVSASVFLELTKEKIAEVGKAVDEWAARQLEKNDDDVLGGGSREEVGRMKGSCRVLHDGSLQYDGTISTILSEASFKPKAIICSGEDDPAVLAKLGKVLGLKWNPGPDTISMHFEYTMPQRKGSRTTVGDVKCTMEIIEDLMFTKRLALTFTAQMFDPLGLCSVWIVRFKIDLRVIVTLNLDWDQEVPEEMQRTWRGLMKEAVAVEPLDFPRSLRTERCQSVPEVIGFWDGSDVAYGCVVYIRWPTDDPEVWHTSIMSSKSRVTPRAGCTTPRAELCGLVMLTRLVKTIVTSMEPAPSRITLCGDSTCTISACELNCASLQPFFSNRVMEALTNMSDIADTCPWPATAQGLCQ